MEVSIGYWYTVRGVGVVNNLTGGWGAMADDGKDALTAQIELLL